MAASLLIDAVWHTVWATTPDNSAVQIMRHARHFRDAAFGILVYLVIAGVGIRLQVSPEVFQELVGTGAAAIGRVVIHRVGMRRVSHVGPDPARAGVR
jgi:hypothetical protein